jgi:hypothetical protein
VLTFETSAELDSFGSLMNCSVITDTLNTYPGVGGHPFQLHTVFKEAGAKIHAINPHLKYLREHPLTPL